MNRYYRNINGTIYTKEEAITFLNTRSSAYKCYTCPCNGGCEAEGKFPCGRRTCVVVQNLARQAQIR